MRVILIKKFSFKRSDFYESGKNMPQICACKTGFPTCLVLRSDCTKKATDWKVCDTKP